MLLCLLPPSTRRSPGSYPLKTQRSALASKNRSQFFPLGEREGGAVPLAFDLQIWFKQEFSLGTRGARAIIQALWTRSSAAAHGGAASRGSTQGNAVEVHRSLPGRSRSPPKVHLMAATRVYVRYYTSRTHPAGGLGRSIRGAGWPRSAFGMTRSDFQKIFVATNSKSGTEHATQSLSLDRTISLAHVLDVMRLQREKYVIGGRRYRR